ncbi:hypothetical protein EWI07_05150 [Sporolactobacillus sp. THM7-4]|nr:hypothetical protein EWI07_05150 [Sporolactobacillus sp. THM7-4]
MKKRLSVLGFIFVLIFAFSVPVATQAASLHTSYDAHTIKKAAYYYSRSEKSTVRGYIPSHKTVRVNTYYKGWYKIIWGNRYVWVNQKYVAKGKYRPLRFQYYAHTIKTAPYHSGPGSKSKVTGHISKNKNISVYKYSNGWYTIKWENKYVYVNKKYVEKGKYIAPSLKPVSYIARQVESSKMYRTLAKHSYEYDYEYDNDYGRGVGVSLDFKQKIDYIFIEPDNYFPYLKNKHNKTQTEKALKVATDAFFGSNTAESKKMYNFVLANSSKDKTATTHIAGHKVSGANEVFAVYR